MLKLVGTVPFRTIAVPVWHRRDWGQYLWPLSIQLFIPRPKLAYFVIDNNILYNLYIIKLLTMLCLREFYNEIIWLRY